MTGASTEAVEGKGYLGSVKHTQRWSQSISFLCATSLKKSDYNDSHNVPSLNHSKGPLHDMTSSVCAIASNFFAHHAWGNGLLADWKVLHLHS